MLPPSNELLFLEWGVYGGRGRKYTSIEGVKVAKVRAKSQSSRKIGWQETIILKVGVVEM